MICWLYTEKAYFLHSITKAMSVIEVSSDSCAFWGKEHAVYLKPFSTILLYTVALHEFQ